MIHVLSSAAKSSNGDAVAVSGTREGVVLQAGHDWDEDCLSFHETPVTVTIDWLTASDLMLALWKLGVDLPSEMRH